MVAEIIRLLQLTRGDVSYPGQLTLPLLDSLGLPLLNCGLSVKYTGPEGEALTTELTDLKNGSFLLDTNVPSKVGSYQLEATSESGQPVAGFPLIYNLTRSVDMEQSYATGWGLQPCQLNDPTPSVIKVHARDQHGTPWSGAECTADIIGPKGLAVKCTFI